MHRFYWVIDNVLAGCSRPGAGRDGDIDRDLATLARLRHRRAADADRDGSAAGTRSSATGSLGLHLPVDDFHAPTTAQMLDALAFLDDARATGTAVAVHCLAGQGRTGTVLAAYLIRGGLSSEQAIAEVRAICPGAIEASPQTAALAGWAAERPWLV